MIILSFVIRKEVWLLILISPKSYCLRSSLIVACSKQTDTFKNMFPVFDFKNKIFMTEQIPEDRTTKVNFTRDEVLP